MQIHGKSNIFSCCLDLSDTPVNPQTIFSEKMNDKTQLPQSALITTSAYGISPIFKTTGHASALGITWLRCPAEKYRQKGSQFGRRAAVKIELVSQRFISYRFRYQVLYTSFKCQMKCTPNLESALSVTVYRITVQILI